MGQRSVPAPFLMKTYQLVDDPSTDDVVSWSEAGTAFVVWKTAEFAKDLLPNYFKHSNFSSFVRQLNTYGFRKTVPDKWEFANEHFKRGSRELLTSICRRKTTQSSKPTGRPDNNDNLISPANSDLGSSSTSSPEGSKNPRNNNSSETQASIQLVDLSDENKKLRKDNQMLSMELAHTKKQCDELISFLTQSIRVSPDQISHIMSEYCPNYRARGDANFKCNNYYDDDDEKECCTKLFGVVLKKKLKRGSAEDDENNGGFE